MFMQILRAGIFGGVLAGLFTGVLQVLMIEPLLINGELFEQGNAIYFNGSAPMIQVADIVGTVRTFEESAMTFLFTTLSTIGFSLLLVGLIALSGTTPTTKEGLIWGMCAFIAVILAPSVGLPPELPGSSAGVLESRQIWWIATVIATGVGIWQIVMHSSAVRSVLGVIAIVLPHIIGAPHANVYMGVTPPEMSGHFVSTVIGVAMVMWLIIGATVAFFYRK